MASSKVMASSNSGNSDLARRPSSVSSAKASPSIPNPTPPIPKGNSNLNQPKDKEIFGASPAKTGPLMTLEGFLQNVYGDDPTASTLLDAEIPLIDAAGAISAAGDRDVANGAEQSSLGGSSGGGGNRKTSDEVWREILAGKSEKKECKVEAPDEMMTLEDFLAKAGAVEEVDVKGSISLPTPGVERLNSGAFPFDPVVQSQYAPPLGTVEGQMMGHGSGAEMIGRGGKRRGAPVLEPMDKAAQQRQRRMIKNRESAARSRERKQAYQVELESLAGKLEEENEQLQREKAERRKARYKQLMEKVVPVVERKKPPRPLRRVRSMG